MSDWLRALIALACVVIIAGGAYNAWNFYSERQAKAESERIYADGRKDCLSTLFQRGLMDKQRRCLADGYISQAEFSHAPAY